MGLHVSLSGSFSVPHNYYRIIHSSIQHALGQNRKAVCVCVCVYYKGWCVLLWLTSYIDAAITANMPSTSIRQTARLHTHILTDAHVHTHTLLSQHYQDRTQAQGSFHDRLSLPKTCTVFWVFDNLCFLHFCCSLELYVLDPKRDWNEKYCRIEYIPRKRLMFWQVVN